MASYSQPDIAATATATRDTRRPSLPRATVFEIFRDYRHLLSVLPGEISQFDQTDVGYEWRCQFNLGDASATANTLELHFSLVDLGGLPRPAAALYLVEHDTDRATNDHLALALEDLEDTHEQLNEQLAGRGASIEALGRAHSFIAELAKLRESLGQLVSWA